MKHCDLTNKKCVPCEGGIDALTKNEAENLLKNTPGWELNENATEIQKRFNFKGYYKTIAFVNAIAWIAQAEGHHPDLEVHYNNCLVRFSTHAVNGLTENDFICAAKVEAITK
jgi:4a-hydroxytetrahydrobiopterin dehydratase